MVQITKKLAEFADRLKYEDLPDNVALRSKQLIVDLAGNIIRARHDAESTASVVSMLNRLGYTHGDCTVLGDDAGYSAPGAAMLNGTLAHSLDFDDTHAAGSIHSGAPITPAAFAAAELVGATGKELVAAIVAGYEIQIRLSLALGPTDHYNRGYHPTATCGVFGAAAAAGKILGLDAQQLASAFGIALSQSAGSMQFLHEGGWTKRSHVGQAAMNGLIAATLAQEGFKGAVDAFEGDAGFFHAYAPAATPTRALEGLMSDWETLNVAVKPYPSCRYSHAALDAVIQLKRDQDIDVADVHKVIVGLSRTGSKIIAEPLAQKHAPKSVVDGQFSMPFCAAVALRTGGLKWDDYDQHLKNPETLALCKLIETRIDDDVEAIFPGSMAGSVSIETSKGTYQAFIDIPKGEPENFLSNEELMEKFNGLSEPYIEPAALGELKDGLLALETIDNVERLLKCSRVRSALALAGE